MSGSTAAPEACAGARAGAGAGAEAAEDAGGTNDLGAGALGAGSRAGSGFGSAGAAAAGEGTDGASPSAGGSSPSAGGFSSSISTLSCGPLSRIWPGKLTMPRFLADLSVPTRASKRLAHRSSAAGRKRCGSAAAPDRGARRGTMGHAAAPSNSVPNCGRVAGTDSEVTRTRGRGKGAKGMRRMHLDNVGPVVPLVAEARCLEAEEVDLAVDVHKAHDGTLQLWREAANNCH